MANTTIRLKKSSVSSHLPTAGQLEHGEIALNYADGKIFYKDPSNNIQQISGSANTFYTVNANGTLLVSTSPTDILTINPGNNIEITGDFLTDTLTIAANLKTVFDTANAAFDSANNVAPQIAPSRNTANAAFATANLAYDLANAAFNLQNNDYTMSNAAYVVANAAYTSANALGIKLNSSYTVANAAFDKANLAASAATINVGLSPPTGVNPGALWWDTAGGRLYIYYTDVDSSQWVEASPSGGTIDYQQLASNVTPLFAGYSDATNAAFSVANAAFNAQNTDFSISNNAYALANTAVQNGSSFITVGDAGILSTNVVTSTATDQILDTFSTSAWRSANYVVTMNAGTDYHTTQVTVIHDGTTAYMTEYGLVYTSNNLALFNTSIVSGNVRFNVTPTFAATTIRVLRTTNK